MPAHPWGSYIVTIPNFVVKVLSRVQLFATPWTAARQASQSITNSQSLLKLMSIELMLSNHVMLCHPFSFCLQYLRASESFLISQVFASGDQIIEPSASASVLTMNIQGCLISLQPKGLSRIISNTTVKKHQFFVTQLSLWSKSHIRTWLLGKP